MNLIITLNNAQMIIEKENLGRNEVKRREENTLFRHGEIQLTSNKNKKRKQTLNKRNLSKISILGERAILDWF